MDDAAERQISKIATPATAASMRRSVRQSAAIFGRFNQLKSFGFDLAHSMK
jgi:hypothetical protein